MSTDPVSDAGDYMDRLSAESAAWDAATATAEQDIRRLFAAFFAGAPVHLPYTGWTGAVPSVKLQPAIDAITDALTSGAPMHALAALLQGTGTVDQLREALVQDYVQRNADDIGQQRALYEPLPRWMREVAA